MKGEAMREAALARVRAAVATARAGLGAGGETLGVAALVVAPFALAFGIWVSWLTWWPNAPLWALTGVAWVGGGLWLAGRMIEIEAVDLGRAAGAGPPDERMAGMAEAGA